MRPKSLATVLCADADPSRTGSAAYLGKFSTVIAVRIDRTLAGGDHGVDDALAP
jgi:hypothetical protein